MRMDENVNPEWKRQCQGSASGRKALQEIKRQQSRIELLEGRQVWLYNQGYQSGHHDTVEGMFTDVLPVDMKTYHDDVVADLISEALAATEDKTRRKHMCGLQGFDPMKGDTCPACAEDKT